MDDVVITSSIMDEQSSVPGDDAAITSSAVEGQSSVPVDDAAITSSTVEEQSSVPVDDAAITSSTVEEQSSVPMDDAVITSSGVEEQSSVPVQDNDNNRSSTGEQFSAPMDDVDKTNAVASSVPMHCAGESSPPIEEQSCVPMDDAETENDQSSVPAGGVEARDESSFHIDDAETTGNQASVPRNDGEDKSLDSDIRSSSLTNGVERTRDPSSAPIDGFETTKYQSSVPMDGVEMTGNEAAGPMGDLQSTGNEASVPMDVETTGNQDSIPKDDGQIHMHIEPGTEEELVDKSVDCTTPHAKPSSITETVPKKKDHALVPLHEFIHLAGQHIANGPPTKKLKAVPPQSNTSQVESVTKHVADVVLILAGLGLVRSGQEPTEVERRLQAEAYGYLGYLVQKFAPKDLILLESIDSLIEDLALRRSDECEVKTFAQILENFRPPQIQAVPAEVQKSSDKKDFQRPSTSGISNDWETQKAVPSAEGQVKTDSLEAQASLERKLPPPLAIDKVDEGKLDVQPRHIMRTIYDIVLNNYPPDFKHQPAYSKLFMNAPVPCEMCKMVIRETANVLACDSCERVFHLRCLQQNHLLKGIPKGDWYCQKCTTNPVNSQDRRKYGRVKPGFAFPDRRTGTSGTSNVAPSKSVQGSTRVEISKKTGVSANMTVKNITQDINSIHTGKVLAEIDPDAQNTSPKLLKPVMNDDGSMGSASVGVVQPNSEPPTIETEMAEKGTKCGSEGNVEREPNKSEPQPTKMAETVGALKQDDPNRLVKDTDRLQIEWVGDELQKQDEKVFYSGCRVGSIIYKLQDCALFRPETPNVPPYIARLQALWEDKTTGSKWVRVNWCYYPADLAMLSGRPPNPEEHEIYESNHGDNNLVGTIQGECLVLRSESYQKEMQRRQELLKSGNTAEGLIPIFLCRWFYDAPSSTFKPATEGS